MRVLVTGATGDLGRALLASPAARSVRLLAQSRTRREGVPSAGIEWVRADLASGDGLAGALQGVDAVIHAASDAHRASEVDVSGTRRLTEAAREVGTRHLVYVSIVGIDRIPLGYYRAKLAAERIVETGGVPYSILRATQFHPFVEGFIAAASRVPIVMPLATRFRFQTVDVTEVAARLWRAIDGGPGGRLADFGGPEIMALGAAAEIWKEVMGVTKRILPLPLPGRIAAAFRGGMATAPGGERGNLRWRDWLLTRTGRDGGDLSR